MSGEEETCKRKASGAQKARKKRIKLMEEVASRPGQLQISKLFFKSSAVTENESTHGSSLTTETKETICSVDADEMEVENNVISGMFDHSNDFANDIENCLNMSESQTIEENIVQMQFDERAETINEGAILYEPTTVSSDVPEEEILESSSTPHNVLRAPCVEGNTPVESDSTSMRSNKLSVEWLLKNYDYLKYSKKRENEKLRGIIHCNVCREFEKVAKAASKNGLVPLSNGVRVDSMDKLQRVVEHLNGNSHKAAMLAKTNHQKWKTQSVSHAWRNYLISREKGLIELLLRLPMDVYNDSLHDTLPAWNWAARSLTQYRSNQFVNSLNEGGFDSVLPSFAPSDSLLRYRNPVCYSEMLEIISQLEVERIAEKINHSVCFCMQIDGSLDRSRCDNKFVCARCIERDGCITNLFLSVVQPIQNGAKGLLEAALSTLNQTKVDRAKLASLTTDGEPANTGRKHGLWKLLEEELNRKILTIWCSCHRSDLAMEDLENLVPELKIWKINVLACSNYFRGSKCYTKSLEDFSKELGINVLSFPAHFEIRFAEHLNALLKAIVRNLPACKKVWSFVVNSSDYDKRDKAKASDFLNTWSYDALQFKLTALMCDITHVFTSLQMGLQKPYLILPDVLTLRDAAVRKLEIMNDSPMPGGQEQSSREKANEKNATIRSHFQIEVNLNEQYDENRSKIVRKAKDLISQRLNIENDNDQSIETIKKIVTATTCSELVKHSVAALKLFLNDDDQENSSKIETLVSNICEQWPILEEIPYLDTSDVGCQYAVRLRHMFAKSSELFQWLLGVFLVTVPHNMGTERVVSHYNKIKSIHRQSTNETTISNRLIISVSGTGTANFDPRPAVVQFLQMKDRRHRISDLEIYQNREFVKKNFRSETLV